MSADESLPRVLTDEEVERIAAEWVKPNAHIGSRYAMKVGVAVRDATLRAAGANQAYLLQAIIDEVHRQFDRLGIPRECRPLHMRAAISAVITLVGKTSEAEPTGRTCGWSSLTPGIDIGSCLLPFGHDGEHEFPPAPSSPGPQGLGPWRTTLQDPAGTGPVIDEIRERIEALEARAEGKS